MGQVNTASEVLLLLAAFSRHEAALAWAQEQAESNWGPVALASPAFNFSETEYYQATMGTGLKKQFFVFQNLIDPERLIDLKLQSNQWEMDYATVQKHAEPRPLNLDPGYITLAKLVLASTKDHSHRIYLDRGIFAEITLSYRAGGWQPSEWTYPDYRRADFQRFFLQGRGYLKSRGAGNDDLGAHRSTERL